MNGFTDESQDKSIFWDYALQVRLDEIVYVHCHQDSEAGGTVILVGQDGVQRPPIHFPKGESFTVLYQFLYKQPDSLVITQV